MIALVLEAALRSFALGAIVWLAMLVLRPRNPHLQKTIWIAVLFASLAMPLAIRTTLAPSFEMPTYFVTLTQSVGDSAQRAPATGLPWSLSAITAVYVLIACGLLTRFALGLFAIWRIRRTAVPLANPDNLDVRVSPKIASPATFGSTILLPATSKDWNKLTLTAILSHERSHVRHGDCYVQWLARVHASIFWFNPLAWWLNRRLADLAETTSDDAVLTTVPNRTAYADLLLECARHPAPTMVTSAARSNISARIERIISNIPPAVPPRRWVRGAAVLALMPLFVLAAATAQSPAMPARPAGNDVNDPMQPKMIDMGDHSDANYPEEAKRNGVEGYAMVNATIDAEGRVTYVQITELSPADASYGFAESATRIAQTMRFSNPKHRATQVQFKVKFALKDKRPPGDTAPGSPGVTTPLNMPPPAATPSR